MPADAGSFRDPRGQVFSAEGRIFRAISADAIDDYRTVESTGVVEALVDAGRLVASTELEAMPAGAPPQAALVLEHPRLQVISYPYEWPFELLKRAALRHLDLHLECLDHSVTLTDASAYNVQFVGVRPVFIDRLALTPYIEGEYWAGYRQFCEQFLNPLLLASRTGMPIQQWYRGALEGISARDTAAVLRLRHKLSHRVWLHVLLQARMTKGEAVESSKRATRRPLPLAGLRGMLSGLRKWIRTLEPHEAPGVWTEYEREHGYSEAEQARKAETVGRFISESRPATVWDIGCNAGFYSQVALEHGAARVVGLDTDVGALDAAVRRADDRGLELTPLVCDVANPSPGQGWARQERTPLEERSKPDAVLALALLHHLVLGRNVPLDQVVAWIVDRAPRGVIEAIPMNDPQVERMMVFRDEHHHAFGVDETREALSRVAEIEDEVRVSASGRVLMVWVRRGDAEFVGRNMGVDDRGIER